MTVRRVLWNPTMTALFQSQNMWKHYRLEGRAVVPDVPDAASTAEFDQATGRVIAIRVPCRNKDGDSEEHIVKVAYPERIGAQAVFTFEHHSPEEVRACVELQALSGGPMLYRCVAFAVSWSWVSNANKG